MSSIMKGLVGESENVNVLYINGKPATKYVRKSDAEKDAAILRAKFPDKKIELKQEMDEAKKMKDDPCWKDYQMVGTKKKGGKEVPNCVPKN